MHVKEKDLPDEVPVFLELLQVARVEREVFGWLNEDAVLELPTSKHHASLDMRIVVDHLLCCQAQSRQSLPRAKISCTDLAGWDSSYIDVSSTGQHVGDRRTDLLSVRQHDLLVDATDDLPQAGLRGMAHDDIARCVRVPVADLGVGLRQRTVRRRLSAEIKHLVDICAIGQVNTHQYDHFVSLVSHRAEEALDIRSDAPVLPVHPGIR